MVGLSSDVDNAIFVRRRMQDDGPHLVTGIRLLVGAVITMTSRCGWRLCLR